MLLRYLNSCYALFNAGILFWGLAVVAAIGGDLSALLACCAIALALFCVHFWHSVNRARKKQAGSHAVTRNRPRRRTIAIIAASTVFEGDIVGCANLRVYGEVVGDICSDGNVEVRRGGCIHGNITAERIVIDSYASGTFKAETVVLLKNAVIKGELCYHRLCIRPGAGFIGEVKCLTQVKQHDTEK